MEINPWLTFTNIESGIIYLVMLEEVWRPRFPLNAEMTGMNDDRRINSSNVFENKLITIPPTTNVICMLKS